MNLPNYRFAVLWDDDGDVMAEVFDDEAEAVHHWEVLKEERRTVGLYVLNQAAVGGEVVCERENP